MIRKIQVPTLVLDSAKARRNLQRMAARVQKAGVQFRPHFKTHQSRTIGKWFREHGVTGITVSSLRMAEYFAADGWKDITVAIPVNLREIERINELAGTIQLNLLAESPEVLTSLDKGLTANVGIFLKIDTGYHRTGIWWKDGGAISDCLSVLNRTPHLHFKGLLAHAGHSYAARGEEELLELHQAQLDIFQALDKRYRKQYPDMVLSYGDTPTCSVATDFGTIDELRPGNFILYDVMQTQIGSCKEDDIAVVMACPVVARHPERGELVVHCGAIHLGKDRMIMEESARSRIGADLKTDLFGWGSDSPAFAPEDRKQRSAETGWGAPQTRGIPSKPAPVRKEPEKGTEIYGWVVELQNHGWGERIPGAYVKSLSQEHGIIRIDAATVNQIPVGTLIGILPIHSCLTVDLADHYLTLNGEQIQIL